MKKIWLFVTLVIACLTLETQAVTDCIPRKELMDKHVVSYQAYNGTLRGCIVSPNFYTMQHKKGRGRLSRTFIIEICEGEPRTSPRTGDSFEICSNLSKPQPKEGAED